MKGERKQNQRENMNNTLIKEYKKYYYNEMIKFNWKYFTAFPLATNDKAFSLKESKDFIYVKILRHIKKRIEVIEDNGSIKFGIPFYAYYVICKECDEPHYHAHMIFNIPEKYEDFIYKYIMSATGNLTGKLETVADVKRMIKYMLKKGNCVIDSNDLRLIPTGYNLKIDKKHFH